MKLKLLSLLVTMCIASMCAQAVVTYKMIENDAAQQMIHDLMARAYGVATAGPAAVKCAITPAGEGVYNVGVEFLKTGTDGTETPLVLPSRLAGGCEYTTEPIRIFPWSRVTGDGPRREAVAIVAYVSASRIS